MLTYMKMTLHLHKCQAIYEHHKHLNFESPPMFQSMLNWYRLFLILFLVSMKIFSHISIPLCLGTWNTIFVILGDFQSPLPVGP